MIFKLDQASGAEDGDFAELAGRIEEYLDSLPVPVAAAMQLMIALDEAISNALKYGEADGVTPEVVVTLEVDDGKLLTEVADSGTPFDPLSLPEPDTSLSVEEREIGGLGIHIVRNLMDEVSYSRDEGWNRLRFSKTFEVE